MLDASHDPARRSWVASAGDPGTDFPIQNLPLGCFGVAPGEEPRLGVAIGDQVLDLRGAVEAGVLRLPPALQAACRAPALNDLMALPTDARRTLRSAVGALLADGSPLADDRKYRAELLRPQADVTMHLPAVIGDYTDFYASVDHAAKVGAMFRPDNPLLPNYKWVPIGYHGRASSVVPGGTPVRRPMGQSKAPDAAQPHFGPSRQLDYELELGAWIAGANPLGSSVPILEAGDRLFGLSILNDWSARDVQSWEYQPLGPFLAKNFATTVSPWVVTREALAPFRVPAFERPAGDPAPLPYLSGAADRAEGGIDVVLDVGLTSAAMRAAGLRPMRVSRSRFAGMYWTLAQLITHHASGGCNLRPGDLLGSGTISGPGREEGGCLLERTLRGKEPLTLPSGESRGFLEDGDEVVMVARCERAGAARIGFGECRGLIVPANG